MRARAAATRAATAEGSTLKAATPR
jgi:hypothetical protein